ncbi:MAG: 30S ribosomal protein S12 methylthiotransferase RimO [Clostridia bacterium]|nr:30S ribosomal protein S12 methylthiotransferase RimO [Clostridia bacterium]
MSIGFVSLGCDKNTVDTEVMIALCAQAGYIIVNKPSEADILVINTCAFIADAKQESIDAIIEMAQYKESRCRLLVVAGCLAQRYAKQIRELLPEADVLVGVGSVSEIVKAIESRSDCFADKNAPCENALPRVLTTPAHYAYLKIAEGCDNCCTYCAIPFIRGHFRSREMNSLIEEAKELADSGVREIIVVAQNTARYGVDLYGEKRLARLLRELCALDGIEWVRVHYCYPEEIDEELISAIAEEKKIVKYLDIPLQHASDSVLKRMGRRLSCEEAKNLIARLRSKIEGLVIRTSFIVGFPGESEEDFEALCAFCEDMRIERVGVFTYSKEEGTAAAKLGGHISKSVKEQRRDRLMLLCATISRKYNASQEGKIYTALCEGFDNNMYVGRIYSQSASVDGKTYFAAQREVLSGEFVNVEIADSDEYDLYGRQA